MASSDLPTDPAQALKTMIIIWFALISGQVMFFVVILVVGQSGSGPATPSSDVGDLLHVISWVALATAAPVGYFVRNQTYKANWQDEVVTPGGYVTGNLLLLAMLEGAGMLALVGAFVSHNLWPNALPALFAVVVQAINFPTGRPMRPTTNPYARPTEGER